MTRAWLPPWFRALSAMLAAALGLVVLLLAQAAIALEPPALAGRVNDHANLLSAEQRQALESLLSTHEQKTQHQFVVLTVPSLEGDPLEDFSLRAVEKWKLGHKKADDGLLLLVVQRERKVRIEVGYGLEGHITDAKTSRVIRNLIVPAFKSGHYAEGITSSIGELIRLDGGGGDREPPPSHGPGGTGGRSPLAVLFLLLPFLGLFFLLRGGGLNRFGGYGSGGGYYGGGRWSGGWGGGSLGGGSFGGSGGGGGGFSGGGGGFGGGGASGSW